MLGLEYTLKKYLRDANFRAPAELKKVHPLGKLPVIEIIDDGGERLVLAESGHIFQYLIAKHNPNKKLLPTSDLDQEKVDYFLHYCEGTLQGLLVSLLVNSKVKAMVPFGLGFLAGRIIGAMNKGYYGSELSKNLQYLESVMQAQHAAGSEFFVGQTLTGADMILSFPLWESLFRDPQRASQRLGENVDYATKYPHLTQWAQKLESFPELQKLLEQD